MRIAGLDHVVLTVRNVATTVDFYERALGMRSFTFAGGTRTALAFGRQKINLHELGHEFLPNAREACPGSADICLLADMALDDVVDHLAAEGSRSSTDPQKPTAPRAHSAPCGCGIPTATS